MFSQCIPAGEGHAERASVRPGSRLTIVHWKSLRLLDSGVRLGAPTHMGSKHLDWGSLRAVRLELPWPTIHIEWHDAPSHQAMRDRIRVGGEADEAAEAVLRLIAHVRDHRPHLVLPGWEQEPVVEWSLARTQGSGAGAGPYRGGGGNAEPVLAERQLARPLRVRWVSGVLRAFGQTATDLARIWVTASFLHQEHASGQVFRVPLEAMSARIVGLGGQHYVVQQPGAPAFYTRLESRIETRNESWVESAPPERHPAEFVSADPARSHLVTYLFGRTAAHTMLFHDDCPVEQHLHTRWRALRQTGGAAHG